MENIAKLQEAIEGVKLTPPQKLIVEKLLKGYKIIVVNQHRMNGGEMHWIKDEKNLNSIEYAGSVYKAFFGLAWSIRKAKGVDFPIGELFISDLRDVKYNN
jgi:hypothetical protein